MDNKCPGRGLPVGVAVAQVICAFAWVGGASVPGTVWMVPDLVLELVLPALMLFLLIVGVVVIVAYRARGAGLLTVTTVFSIGVLAFALFVILFLPSTLPDF